MERQIPDSENRLVLLHALALLGQASDDQLLIYVTDLGLMNYFSLQLNLSELLSDGYVAVRRHPYGLLYRITPSGRYTLEQFSRILPMSSRSRITETAPAYKSRFRNEQQMPAKESALPDGSLCLCLQLLEKEAILLDMHMLVDHHLSCLSERWARSAPEIYGLITSVLSENYVEDRVQNLSSEDAVLTKTGRNDWTLYLSDQHDNPAFTLILSLSDEKLALHWGKTWENNKESLHAGILALLEHGI